MKNLLLGLIVLLWANCLSAQGLNPGRNLPSQNGKSIDALNPKEYIIAEIRVVGTRFLDGNALSSMSGLSKGQKITIPGSAVSDAIKRLWKSGILGDVKIYADRIVGDDIYLVIDLKERPKLSRYVFSGVRKGEETALKDKVNIPGKIVTQSLLRNTKRTVEDHFKEKGFLNCSVNIIQVQDTILSNSVLLRINVNKGNRVKIQSLEIEGNEAIPDKKLAKKLKKTKQRKAFRIFSSSKFVKDLYEEDKDNLISYYNSQGYRDARILSDSVYAVDDKLINLVIKVEEGQKYYYRNITWAGNYVYDDKTLSRVLGINKGDVYDLETLEKRLNFSQTDLDITSLYMDDGYLFFNVNPVEVAVVGDSIDIVMQIYEGTQANVNRVILKGNDKTSDKVVLREIRTVPGQKFSRTDLIRSQREIATLGYFDQEQIGITPLPNINDGTVDIEYSVVEKPSDQIELSGGWGGAFGFVGTLGLVFNNFSLRKLFKFKDWGGILPSGDGQRLALRVQSTGRRFQTYTMTFTEPWLGGRKPNSFSVNLSHSVQRTFSGSEQIGSLQVTGVTFSLGRRLRWPDNFFTLSNSVSFLRYNLDNFTNILGFTDGIARNVAFNTTFARNSIDNPTFPRRGSSLSLSLSLTPPYSLFRSDQNFSEQTDEEKFRWVEYHKWMIDNSWFTELFAKFVLHTRAHFGFIGAYNSELGVGPFERFVLGGDGLTGQNFLLGTDIIGLRGYENNSITPPGVSGGVVYNKFVMELRFPVSLNPAATVFLLGFIEGGNNFSNFSEYNPFNLKRSAGFGARIFMPAFGLIGLDWGYGFDDIPTAPGASGPQFHFTIGQQLR